MNSRIYNVVPSPDDPRDRKLLRAPSLATPAADLPSAYNVENYNVFPIWDQKDGGACVSFTTAAAFAYLQRKFFDEDLDPSRLFIYSQTKYFDSQDYSADNGLYLRDACGVLRLMGTCKEQTWPYTADRFSVRPPDSAIAEAANYSRRLSYSLAVPTLRVLQYILHDRNTPLMMAFEIYDSFKPDQNGIIPVPNRANDKLLGGHAVLIVGYDNSKAAFKVRNSYGEAWGVNGYCWMPYEYVLNTEYCYEHRFFEPTNERLEMTPDSSLPPLKVETTYNSYIIVSLILLIIALIWYFMFPVVSTNRWKLAASS